MTIASPRGIAKRVKCWGSHYQFQIHSPPCSLTVISSWSLYFNLNCELYTFLNGAQQVVWISLVDGVSRWCSNMFVLVLSVRNLNTWSIYELCSRLLSKFTYLCSQKYQFETQVSIEIKGIQIYNNGRFLFLFYFISTIVEVLNRCSQPLVV